MTTPSTSQAISLAYNELYKVGLPGAFNFMMFFTDGIPNSVTVNFQNMMLSSSGCLDSAGKSLASGNGNFVDQSSQLDTGLDHAERLLQREHSRRADRRDCIRRSFGFRQLWRSQVPRCQPREPEPRNHHQRQRAWMRLPGQRVKLRARFSKAAAHRRVGKFARRTIPIMLITTDGSGNIVSELSTADNGTPLTADNLSSTLAARTPRTAPL